jgi:hypothetical protein
MIWLLYNSGLVIWQVGPLTLDVSASSLDKDV